MIIPFNERAVEMGLEPFAGGFKYSDQYADILYRPLSTSYSAEDRHITDNYMSPYYAIFTKSVDQSNTSFVYCGIVSKIYKFMGHDVLNQRARDSILEIGLPVVRENPILSQRLTSMRNEIIIQSSVNVPSYDDVFPVMILHNTYDGSGAAVVTFGIGMYTNDRWITFSFNLGQLRQVHIESSDTTMTSSVETYLETFTENISDMITQSFSAQVTEDDLLSTLDVIEELGKGRRKEIAKILEELPPSRTIDQLPPLPSAWHVFLAIVRYSSFEPNLNVKRLLENVAERVLVIPTRMHEVLEHLQG